MVSESCHDQLIRVQEKHLGHSNMRRIILLPGVQSGGAWGTATMVSIAASLNVRGALLLCQALTEEGVNIIEAGPTSTRLLVKVTKVIRIIVQSQLFKPAYAVNLESNRCTVYEKVCVYTAGCFCAKDFVTLAG